MKIWVRLVGGILIILTIAWSGMIWWSTVQQRESAIEQARSYSYSVHHMTLSGLTGMMITGTVSQRAVFLDQIRQSEDIKELRVIRGEAVSNQFGPGEGGESNADPVEREAMQAAQPYIQVVQDGDGESLRAVIPAIAQKNYLGKNCLTCHSVPEGSVLGAVSMRISLDKVNASVLDFRLKIVVAALVLMMPVALFVYLFINHSVCIPLQMIARNLNDIADGDGDLTRRLVVCGKDGIGEISQAFNKLMVKLQSTINDIKLGAEQVLTTSINLASVSAQGAANSQMQSQEAYAMAAQAEIMTYNIDGIGSQADEVHGVTTRSHELSLRGGEIIYNAVTEMNKITETVSESSNIIQDLGRQSDQISTIVKVIKEVAEQTNLLALNAAIEAARRRTGERVCGGGR
ncbi:MAG: methyl-accepting chemotaxis protein [Gallionella sp.]|nr:methyl-accepting chemotaxis protein [Gallionella sp.]